MDDQIDVLGGMAEDSPKVLVRVHRQCGYVIGDGWRPFHAVGSHMYESGGFLNTVGKVPIRSVTSEAFLWYKQIVDGGNQSGKRGDKFPSNLRWI